MSPAIRNIVLQNFCRIAIGSLPYRDKVRGQSHVDKGHNYTDIGTRPLGSYCGRCKQEGGVMMLEVNSKYISKNVTPEFLLCIYRGARSPCGSLAKRLYLAGKVGILA